MKKICPKCITTYNQEENFCPVCGSKLMDEVNYYGVKFYEGDESAFDEIFRLTRKQILSQLDYNVYNEADRDDCAQDIYIKLFKQIHSFDPEKGDFRVWFSVLRENCIKSYITKYEKTKDKLDYVGEDTDAFDNANELMLQYESSMSQKEMTEILNEILKAVPEKQRICIVRYFYDGKKQKEIADDLGISIKTVDSRIRLGKKAVEEKVTELQEKQGIKLYSLTPFLFFLFLGKTVNASASELDLATIKKAIAAGHPVEIEHKVAEDMKTSEAPILDKDVAKKGFLSTLQGKLVVGIVTVAILGGGGYAILHHEPVKTETEKTITDDASNSNTEKDSNEDTTSNTDSTPVQEPSDEESAAGSNNSSTVAENGLPGEYPKYFTFSGGAGGWSSELEINSDGTYMGYYQDSDAGDTGLDNPNGVAYFTRVSGTYSDIEKLDDYSYVITVNEIQLTGQDEERLEDGIDYIYQGDAFPGLDSIQSGSKLTLYLPGTLVSSIPEECLLWIYQPDSDGDGAIDKFILYNEDGQEGFWESAPFFLNKK